MGVTAARIHKVRGTQEEKWKLFIFSLFYTPDNFVSTLLKCHILPYGIFEPRSLYKLMLLAGLISWPGGREGGPLDLTLTKTSHRDLQMRLNTHSQVHRGLKAALIQPEFIKYTLLWHFFIFNVLSSLSTLKRCVCVCVCFLCIFVLQCTFS